MTNDTRPLTILCLASYFKGHDFIRECHRLGARVLIHGRDFGEARAEANRLVDLADQSGGADNCTVVAVRCY